MTESTFTLIDETRPVTTRARIEVDGRCVLSPQAVHEALGWELKPEGLCRGDTCIPLPDRAPAINADGIELSALADALGRPLAVDPDHAAATLGTSSGERREQFTSLEAPDFTLPDLSGAMHSLSDFRGKKILLIAYASW